MGLKGHANILAIFTFQLEHIQGPGHPHFKKHGRGRASELHDISQFSTVEIFLRHRSKEMNPSLIDPQNNLDG